MKTVLRVKLKNQGFHIHYLGCDTETNTQSTKRIVQRTRVNVMDYKNLLRRSVFFSILT